MATRNSDYALLTELQALAAQVGQPTLFSAYYKAAVAGQQPVINKPGALKFFNVTVNGEEQVQGLHYTDDGAGNLTILAAAGVDVDELVQYCYVTGPLEAAPPVGFGDLLGAPGDNAALAAALAAAGTPYTDADAKAALGPFLGPQFRAETAFENGQQVGTGAYEAGGIVALPAAPGPFSVALAPATGQGGLVLFRRRAGATTTATVNLSSGTVDGASSFTLGPGEWKQYVIPAGSDEGSTAYTLQLSGGLSRLPTPGTGLEMVGNTYQLQQAAGTPLGPGTPQSLISASDGTVVTGNPTADDYTASGFLAVVPGAPFAVVFPPNEPNTGALQFAAFYAADKTYLRGVVVFQDPYQGFVPPGAYFVRQAVLTTAYAHTVLSGGVLSYAKAIKRGAITYQPNALGVMELPAASGTLTGPWQPNTFYEQYNQFIYQNVTYYATAAFASGATFDPAKATPLPGGTGGTGGTGTPSTGSIDYANPVTLTGPATLAPNKAYTLTGSGYAVVLPNPAANVGALVFLLVASGAAGLYPITGTDYALYAAESLTLRAGANGWSKTGGELLAMEARIETTLDQQNAVTVNDYYRVPLSVAVRAVPAVPALVDLPNAQLVVQRAGRAVVSGGVTLANVTTGGGYFLGVKVTSASGAVSYPAQIISAAANNGLVQGVIPVPQQRYAVGDRITLYTFAENNGGNLRGLRAGSQCFLSYSEVV